MADNLELNLGGHRRLVPGVHGLVEGRDDNFARQGLHQGRSVEVGHIVR